MQDLAQQLLIVLGNFWHEMNANIFEDILD